MASFCAYPAWYIFPRWRRPRAPLGPPRGGCSIYRRRFILLAAHSYPLLLPASPFPLFSFPICVPVRLVCRLASRLVMSSRLMRSVASCRLSCRLACSSRRLVSAGRLVSRRFVLLFARSRFACRGGLALRSHVVPFLPWHPVSSLRLVGLVSFSPVISFHLTRGRLGSVLVPGFPCSRRSVLLVAIHLRPALASLLVSCGRGVFYLIISSHPPSRYSSASAHLVSSPVLNIAGRGASRLVPRPGLVSALVSDEAGRRASRHPISSSCPVLVSFAVSCRRVVSSLVIPCRLIR